MISIFKLINPRNFYCFAVAFASVLFFTNPLSVNASNTLSLILTIDGGNSSVSVNGEEVELGWYVDGPIKDCVIKQKIGTETTVIHTIDTTTLPTSGTKMVTPPENTSTNYILICDQVQDVGVVNTNFPTVDISIDQGTTLMVNSLTGRVDNVGVRWSSQNTNRCSLLWREKSSAPGVKIFETNGGDYWYQNSTSGVVGYDGDPRSVTETTTFFITCYNDNIGESITDSITLNVTNPPPPNPPTLNMWSPHFPSVSVNEIYGYAWVDVGFNAQHVTSCAQSAYYADGTQYPNPPGWGAGSYVTAYNFTGIRISTTTDFRVTCSREEVNIAGTVYPAESITKTLRIMVVPPVGVTTIEAWDRAGIPAVTATIAANPNPANKNALSGLATTEVTITRENADWCDRGAYYTNNTPTDYSDDIGFWLSGWTGRVYGNGTSAFSVNLSTTTRLDLYCAREYDISFGTPAEVENGTELASTLAVTIDSTEVVPDPAVSVYGNAFIVSVDTIWSTATEKNGFNAIYGWPRIMENSSSAATNNKISFPFNRPAGMNGLLDVYIKVCDENDGESTFRMLSDNAGLIGSVTTDSTSASSDACDWGTIKFRKIGDEVNFVNGETVTIECDTPADGERCRIAEILYGVDGIVTTPQVNPIVTSVNVPTLWISENTTECDSFNAQRINGTGYVWHWGGGTAGIINNNISTTTTFSLRCRRGGDGRVADDSILASVPYSTTISAETAIATGQCMDDGSLGNVFGTIISSPPEGYGPDINGYCIPLVDLAAGAMSVNATAATPDGVNGQWDNLPVYLIVQNWGPGELPDDSNMPYKFVIDFDDLLTITNYTSPLYYLNDALIAPTDPTVPTESNSLDNRVDNVNFGTHKFCARVNMDGTVFPEANTLLVNNVKCVTEIIPVPEPPMSITADRNLIRRNQSVTISWSAHTSYPLNCIVRGPGGVSDSFDASARYPHPGGAYTNSITTTALTNTSEFILQCTEPITDTVFVKKMQIDIVPESEEI